MENNEIYYDTEFIEGMQDKRFLGIKIGKTNPTIDLISIGMVKQDGKEYYAVSKDFNLKEAWNRWDGEYHDQSGFAKQYGFPPRKKYWIRENVLLPIFRDFIIKSEDLWHAYSKEEEYNNFLDAVNNGESDHLFTYKRFKRMLEKYGKSRNDIAEDVFTFCTGEEMTLEKVRYYKPNITPVKLYAYYSSYDHVALCWIFGKMIELPDGFPMYTTDLKQIMDENQAKRDVLAKEQVDYQMKMMEKGIFPNINFEHSLKNHHMFPKQENEHNALSDARWNKKLHDFLKKMSF